MAKLSVKKALQAIPMNDPLLGLVLENAMKWDRSAGYPAQMGWILAQARACSYIRM